jgi:GAF domain-containing protein
MSAPLRPIGPESFAQLAHCLEVGAAHDPRVESLFENLFKAQQELFELVLGGAGLNDVLARLANVLDRVMAPARCGIALFDKTAGRLTHHAAPHLWPELKPSSEASAAQAPGPIEAALVQGGRIVASDFQIETRWPIFAGKALVRGLRACWAEPADCGDGVAAVIALFHAEPAEPNAKDDRALKATASMAACAIKATRRGQSRGIYSQGPRRAH